jgi:hypothetical protein
MGWTAYFKEIELREGLGEVLWKMLSLDEDDFAWEAHTLFPDLPKEVLLEGYDFLRRSTADVDGDQLWPAEGVDNPHLDKLLPFLGKIARPGSLIAADLDGELAGWVVQEDGSVKELVAGFMDPESGTFWPLRATQPEDEA